MLFPTTQCAATYTHESSDRFNQTHGSLYLLKGSNWPFMPLYVFVDLSLKKRVSVCVNCSRGSGQRAFFGTSWGSLSRWYLLGDIYFFYTAAPSNAPPLCIRNHPPNSYSIELYDVCTYSWSGYSQCTLPKLQLHAACVARPRTLGKLELLHMSKANTGISPPA